MDYQTLWRIELQLSDNTDSNMHTWKIGKFEYLTSFTSIFNRKIVEDEIW